jgi:hypothetical protein
LSFIIKITVPNYKTIGAEAVDINVCSTEVELKISVGIDLSNDAIAVIVSKVVFC